MYSVCLQTGYASFFVNVDKAISNAVLQISSAFSPAANQVASSGGRPGFVCLFPSPLAISRSVEFALPSSYLALEVTDAGEPEQAFQIIS